MKSLTDGSTVGPNSEYCPVCGGHAGTGGILHTPWCPWLQGDKVVYDADRFNQLFDFRDLRSGWICPRCRTVWSPDVLQCTCKVVPAHSDSTNNQYPPISSESHNG